MKRDRHTVAMRHAEMLAMIRERQEVLVEELCEAFAVSPMTVRRDLQLLEEQGKINRFHGGATVDLRPGSGPGRNDAAVGRELIAHADEYFILADFTKVGKTSAYASFHLEKKGTVITDALAPEEVVAQLRAAGMKVVQVRASDLTQAKKVPV